MFKTIVVPIDGSEHAKKAVDMAADLASKYDARILLSHVLMRHTPAFDLKRLCNDLQAPDTLIAKLDELGSAMYDTAAVAYAHAPVIVPDGVLAAVGDIILNDAKKTVETKGVRNVSVALTDGDPATCILATAEQDQADLIVMGSRGLGKFTGLLMGSVSHKVSHLSNCSCLTAK